MTEGQVNVRNALDLISSATVKNRSEGLSDLKQIFRHNGQTARVESLDDEIYHHVFEVLFQCAGKERSGYLKANKDVVKKSAAGRLALCASTIRAVLEVGVKQINISTVKALLDHILDALPHPEGGHCEPLVDEYPKILRAIVDDQVHVEHLKEEKWTQVTEFCLDAVQLYSSSIDPQRSIISNGNSSHYTPTASIRISRSFASQPGTRAGLSINPAVEFVMCVRRLTQAPNSPLIRCSAEILECMMEFVRSAQVVGRGHHDAFATINSVINRVRDDRIDLLHGFLPNFVPVVRDMWTIKRSSIRDELFVAMIYSEEHIKSMILSPDNHGFRDDVERLRTTMLSEYLKRPEKDMLHLDDVVLQRRPFTEFLEKRPFTKCLTLKCARSEDHWMTLYLISSLSVMLDRARVLAPTSGLQDKSGHGQHNDSDGMEAPRKRRRVLNLHEDYLRQLSHSQSTAKAGILQILIFMHDMLHMDAEELKSSIQRIAPGLDDSSPTVSSWTMVCLTTCAIQETAESNIMGDVWSTLTKVISRSLPNSAVSRPASQMLDTLLERRLVSSFATSELSEAMLTAADLNGPSVLCEASIALWNTLLRSRQAENPSSSGPFAEQALRWFFTKWKPAQISNKGNKRDAAAYDVTDLMSPFYTCLGLPVPSRNRSVVTLLGRLSQTRLQVSKGLDLSTYLLDSGDRLHEPDGRIGQEKCNNLSTDARVVASQEISGIQLVIADLMIAESANVATIWKEILEDRPQAVTPDLVQRLLAFGVVISTLLELEPFKARSRLATLRKQNDELLNDVCALLSKADCSQDCVDAALSLLNELLPNPQDIPTVDPIVFKRRGVLSLVLHLFRALGERRKSHTSSGLRDSYDTMELDDEFESQEGSPLGSQHLSDAFRDDVGASSNIISLRTSTMGYLYLITSAFEASTLDDSTHSVPSAFVLYITHLPDHELYASRPLIKAVAQSQIPVPTAVDLLEHLAVTFLQEYEFERCEVAVLCCLEAVTGFATEWMQPGADTDRIGIQIFEWAFKTVLRPGIASAQVQISFADLCYRLAQLQFPSARTSIFNLFALGNCSVKYHTAQLIGEVFNRWKLSEHDAAFEDLRQHHLPNDLSQKEEIAMRLYVLAELAAKWQTLRRKCVYHIYETAAAMDPGARSHAKSCIRKVTHRLSLSNPSSLFQLFAPQLLYTWLETGQLSSAPYEIFGYHGLDAMVLDVEGEVVAQMLMRQKEADLQSISKMLNKSMNRLFMDSFSRCAAYAISWDIVNSAELATPVKSSESFLSSCLGKDEYSRLFRSRFHEVAGIILCAAGEIELINRALNKKKVYSSQAKALDEMESLCSSKMQLPAPQQPSFHVKYLLDQLERVCRRILLTSTEIWSPDRYVYSFRMILEQMGPARGSLYACASIRKLRVLIALAGNVALEGYPLDMAIHSLRPYLADQQCIDDTIGIIRYLCHHGKPSLHYRLPQFGGSAVAILLSTRAFMSATQDSTTQDSQHLASKEKVTLFRTWFSQFLNGFTAQIADAYRRRRFRALMQNATESSARGNALSGGAEGNLLLEILNDGEGHPVKLLDDMDRASLLEIMQEAFDPLPPSSNDIINSDASAKTFANQLWVLINRSGVNANFAVWAARSIGRGFTSANDSRAFLRSTVTRSLPAVAMPSSAVTVQSPSHPPTVISRLRILSRLQQVLRSSKSVEVGVAEEALRICIERAAQDPASRYCIENSLTHAVQQALFVPDRSRSMIEHKPLSLREVGMSERKQDTTRWISDVCLALVVSCLQDPVLGALTHVLQVIPDISPDLFPQILHLSLAVDAKGDGSVRKIFSDVSRAWYEREDAISLRKVKILLNGMLYLREQPYPLETTNTDRDNWLDIDYIKAAHAASRCGMYATALLFAETHAPGQTANGSSKRSSVTKESVLPADLLLSIYQNLDDPDSFYGVPQTEGLDSLLARLEYERDGARSLLFRGAKLDSQMRRTGQMRATDTAGMIHSLMDMNLNSLAHVALSSSRMGNVGLSLVDNALEAALKLQQWDVKAPVANTSATGIVYGTLQNVHNATTGPEVRNVLDSSFFAAKELAISMANSLTSMTKVLTCLTILSEVDEVLSSSSGALKEVCIRQASRYTSSKCSNYADLQPILSSRRTLFNLLTHSETLQKLVGTGPRELAAHEIRMLLSTSAVARSHGALNESLATATHLQDSIEDCRRIGLRIEAVAEFEVARVLWDQGEHHSSIRMLQRLVAEVDFDKESLAPGLSKVYATLAYRIDQARMEKPQEILDHYLKKAVHELKGRTVGDEAGEVFHEFASFCDQQLHRPDSLEDFVRVEKLRKQRQEEATYFKEQAKATKDRSERHRLGKSYEQARRWLKLDEEEFQRLRAEREVFTELSVQNYLQALTASDGHNDDVLRFVTLWFQFADMTLANDTVKRMVADVPSYKFTSVMNQLSSRLQADTSAFQELLSGLVFRICTDHPYHGMYQIFSGASPQGIRDESSKSRQEATERLAARFKRHSRALAHWKTIQEVHHLYDQAAIAGNRHELASGDEIKLEDLPITRDMARKVPKAKIPPITLQVDPRSDCDYNSLPIIHHFKPYMKIAGGLSKPKIVTVVASDGRYFRQLLKGGSDDLRQDAVMEQVFEQVSGFLGRHPATRQRDLLIRTYKVIPLSAASGVIEFVPNTIPLHDVVLPMHEKYHPKDLRYNAVRQKIGSAKDETNETRIKTFVDCTARYSPAMRFWFLENFIDPDEWFERRLAYTRSMAAISILGYVMGLGDRHLHNILVDRKSGEIVHIDLGVAFEAGRVLPIPEIIPFRLTRDLVDGMGYTKTEGVFRRCCEFTLDALREERESIMTVLNVLRYDPLCTWTVSPRKARKMQDELDEEDLAALDQIAEQASRKANDEAGEAGRALTVVEKKLSKTLSTAATVNELIQQATDERNLALLFVGWSAWV